MLKGQFRIVEESILFLVGILIVSMVIMSFQSVEKKLKDTSIHDHFLSVASYLENGIMKVSKYDNAEIRLKIPNKLSDRVYVVELKNGSILIYDYLKPSTNISESLFGMGSKKSFSGYVFSSAGYLIIRSSNKNITVGR